MQPLYVRGANVGEVGRHSMVVDSGWPRIRSPIRAALLGPADGDGAVGAQRQGMDARRRPPRCRSRRRDTAAGPRRSRRADREPRRRVHERPDSVPRRTADRHTRIVDRSAIRLRSWSASFSSATLRATRSDGSSASETSPLGRVEILIISSLSTFAVSARSITALAGRS